MRGGKRGPRQKERAAASLLANTGALLASRLTIAVLGWIGTVLIVRTLSVEDYGRFTLIFSVLGVLSIVTDMGIGRVALSGLLAAGPDRPRFAGSYVLLRCLLGVLGYGVALAFVAAVYPGEVVRATAVAGIVVVLATPANAYTTVFQAHRRMRGVAVAQALGRVAQLGLTAAIAATGGSLLLFTVPAVLAEIVLLVWVVPAAHRLVTFHYRPRLRTWWELLREAAPLAVGTALATLYYRVDTIMLSVLDTFRAVGVYGVAYKFVDLAHFVPTAVTIAVLPLLVAAWPDQLSAFRYSLRRGATILMIAAGFIAVQFLLFAEPLIRLLYGDQYAEATVAARIVVASECLAFVTSLALIALVAVGRHRRYPLVALVGLILNVGLNLALIPQYSYLGAAAATLATDIVVLVWMCLEVRRVEGLRPLPRPPVWRLAVVVAISGSAGVGLAAVLPWPVAAGLVGVIFAAGVVVLRAAGPGGLRALRQDAEPASG